MKLRRRHRVRRDYLSDPERLSGFLANRSGFSAYHSGKVEITLIKGSGLVSVNAGIANGWGLVNYIGNAQELTSNGTELRARGGAYKDNMSECSLDLDRPHGGGADDVTGFRVVQETS